MNIDLAGTPGTGTGDGAADNVIVNGTNSADAITAAGNNGRPARPASPRQ